MKSALLVIFLASSAFCQSPASIPSAQPACGPMPAQFQIKTGAGQPLEPQVESGRALIYVVEDQKYKAVKDVTVRIGVDGAWIGATRGDSYLYFSLEPGEHHLCVDWLSDFLPSGRAVSRFGFTAEPRHVYYFRARTQGGVGSLTERNGSGDTAFIDLDLVNSDEGRLLVASSLLSVSHAKK